ASFPGSDTASWIPRSRPPCSRWSSAASSSSLPGSSSAVPDRNTLALGCLDSTTLGPFCRGTCKKCTILAASFSPSFLVRVAKLYRRNDLTGSPSLSSALGTRLASYHPQLVRRHRDECSGLEQKRLGS